jgi:uncharacterized protein (TIGR00255 family)
MTGFGSAEGEVAGGRLRIEIRCVNHRFYNPQIKLPSELTALEPEIRELLRRLLDRGHVAVSARWVDAPARAATLHLNIERAREVVAALRQLKRKLKLKGEPDLSFVARLPDVLASESAGAETDVPWAEVAPVVERAARDVVGMREREGRALGADLLSCLDALDRAAALVATRAPERLTVERDRLTAVVRELTSGVTIDAQRVALEIALLAERLDISEELVRLRTHLAAARTALGASDGSPRPGGGTGRASVGKELGFIAQELLREVNTIGSKANDAVITQAVIGMKGELERFREQIENLE